MNNHLIISKKLFFGSLAVVSIFIASTVSAFLYKEKSTVFAPSSEPKDSALAINIHPPIFPKSASFAAEEVPLNQPDIRERFDRELTINAYLQASAILNLKQTTRWFPQIENTLRANGLPDDFKYLCMAESALQPVASRVGAAGFWQFMDETGKKYGLEINDEVDERYNVEKSTEAACAYLNRIKNMLGSWTLAAAAYNCGEGGTQRFMTMQHQNNYYDLLLPEETMRYLFRILAIKEIYTHPARYGFNLNEADYYPLYSFKNVEVSSPIEDLAQFAIDNGTSYKWLKILNPWLRKPYLKNIKHKTYIIKLPA